MSAIDSHAWLGTLRRYVVLGLLLNVCWEILQLPLYTIWTTGAGRAIFFALVHCTAGRVIRMFAPNQWGPNVVTLESRKLMICLPNLVFESGFDLNIEN